MKKLYSLILMLLLLIPQGARAAGLFFECDGKFYSCDYGLSFQFYVDGSRPRYLASISSAALCAPPIPYKYEGVVTFPETVYFPGADYVNEDDGLQVHAEPNPFLEVKGCTQNAFEYSPNLIKVIFPEGKLFGHAASFKGCSNLLAVENMDLRYVVAHQFDLCSSLTDIDLSRTTWIEEYAFSGCSSLKDIQFIGPRIEKYAFSRCRGLETISFEKSPHFYDGVFSECNNIKKVWVKDKKYPYTFNDNVFTQTVYENALLIVPKGSVETYKSTDGWKNFRNIIEEGSEPSDIDDPHGDNPQGEGNKTGDLNKDGEVNGTDLVALVDLIIKPSPIEYAYRIIFDLNGDGEVNGTDLVALVNLIMNAEPSNARRAATRGNDFSNTSVSIEPLHIGAGESRKMTISVSNPDMDVTMMQFDMVLPKGLRVNRIGNYMEYELTDRTSSDKHSAYIRDKCDFTRVLIASGTNAILDGTEGGVIRLTLTADDDFEGGNIEFKNMLCTSPDLHEARPQSFTAYIAGNATDIQEINSESTGSAIYNLSGQRLKTIHKGLNIVNGKKVMVK